MLSLFLTVLTTLTCWMLSSNASIVERTNHVFKITDKNFEQMVNFTRDNEGALLLYFYSDWAEPTHNFYTEYQKAAKQLHNDGDAIYLGKVNAAHERKLVNNYEVYDYPKVIVLASNEGMKFRIYEGEKTSEDIVEHMRRIIPQGPKFFQTLEKFYEIASQGHHLVTGFFESNTNEDYKLFVKGARIMRYVNFAYTTNIQLGEKLGLKNPKNGIAIFYKREMLGNSENKFLEKQDDSTLYQWVTNNYLLDVDVYSLPSSLYYVDEYRFITMLVFRQINLKEPNPNIVYFRNRMGAMYEKLKPYTFLALASEDHWKFLAEKIDSQNPVELVAFKDLKWYKSEVPIMRANFTFDAEVLENFVHDVYYNRIPEFVKSEPFPEQEYDSGIRNLVGRNFEQEINKPGEEYIIMFYTEWNPH